MKRFLVLFIILLTALSLFSCAFGDEDNVDLPHPEIPEDIDVSDAVILPEYKGLTIVKGLDETRGEAIWEIVLENSEIVEYPSLLLSYYKSQALTKYKILASEAGVSYNELLDTLGLSENDVDEEAKALTKSELVALAIIKNEDITLTDDEKDRLFDKYAEKLAGELGRELEYVKSKLHDEVLDAMLHDKMIEFLITQNTFVPEE